eukprot:COSAG02_NODE_54093_length_298_cov_0.693467_2_plen_42_part_01
MFLSAHIPPFRLAVVVLLYSTKAHGRRRRTCVTMTQSPPQAW